MAPSGASNRWASTERGSGASSTTRGRPTRVTTRPASEAATALPTAYDVTAKPDSSAVWPSPLLVAEGQRQRKSGYRREESKCEHYAGRVGRHPEQAQLDQRILPQPGEPAQIEWGTAARRSSSTDRAARARSSAVSTPMGWFSSLTTTAMPLR
jgi:hypothetical protein